MFPDMYDRRRPASTRPDLVEARLGSPGAGPPDTPRTPQRVQGYGSFEYFQQSLHEIRRQSAPYILATYYGSHFEKAHFARGIENFQADMAADPPFARKLLTSIIDRNMVMLESILWMEEIDGVLLGSDWGRTTPVFTYQSPPA